MSEEATTTTAPNPDEAAEAEMKAAAKWLVASSGAVVAVLIAGLQLKDIGAVTGWALGIAVLGVVAALVPVVLFLATAALVLVAPRPSLSSFLDQEKAEFGPAPPPGLRDPKDPLLKYLVVTRRLELLGPDRDDITALVEEQSAVHNFQFSGSEMRIGQKVLKPTVDADKELVAARKLDLETSIAKVTAAAALWHTQRRYEALLSWKRLLPYGILLLAGVLTMAILASGGTKSPAITKPTPLEIAMPTDPQVLRDAGADTSCGGLTLDGVAVGGTLAKPQVVTRPSGKCPAQRFRATGEFVVTPIVDNSAP